MSDLEERHYSPLHAWHEAHGAEYLWEDGWPWTNHEGADPMTEYEAIRTGAGIWDLFSTCKYEVTGPDAARLVQRRFTNRVDDMRPGQARYGAFVDENGLMVDDGNAYRYADDRFVLMINTPTLEEWFRETAGDLDARIRHRTEDFGMIAVEAQAAGAPVIAFGRGGAAETVVEPGDASGRAPTGVFFREPTSESLACALRAFTDLEPKLDGAAPRANAERFSLARFREGIREAIAEVVS